MSHCRFVISESGYVYWHIRGRIQCHVRNAAPLGHISHLLQQRTPIGKLVRRWWASYLTQLDRQFPSASSKPATIHRLGDCVRGPSRFNH
jgi:hypothetical protein